MARRKKERGILQRSAAVRSSRRPRGIAEVSMPVQMPGDPIGRVEVKARHCAITASALFAAFAILPAVLVCALAFSIARRIQRRSYYARERGRRIELRDGRRMMLGEYARLDEVVQGMDGTCYVYDREEYARRMAMERDRRRICRHATLNRMPTSAEIREQWGRVRKSHEEMLRFGSLLCDLEAYVDNSILRSVDGKAVGRKPGIKGWLAANCPEVGAHYSSAMRYKALAVKTRQAIGLAEPYPVSTALGDAVKRNGTGNEISVGIAGNEESSWLTSGAGSRVGQGRVAADAGQGGGVSHGAGQGGRMAMPGLEDGGNGTPAGAADGERKKMRRLLERARRFDEEAGAAGRATQAALARAVKAEVEPSAALAVFCVEGGARLA